MRTRKTDLRKSVRIAEKNSTSHHVQMGILSTLSAAEGWQLIPKHDVVCVVVYTLAAGRASHLEAQGVCLVCSALESVD